MIDTSLEVFVSWGVHFEMLKWKQHFRKSLCTHKREKLWFERDTYEKGFIPYMTRMF